MSRNQIDDNAIVISDDDADDRAMDPDEREARRLQKEFDNEQQYQMILGPTSDINMLKAEENIFSHRQNTAEFGGGSPNNL